MTTVEIETKDNQQHPTKVMLITGSRQGLGQQLASFYLDAGWQVVGCSRGPGALDHPQYRHFQLDVADEDAVKAMFSAIKKQYRRLDVLVNNAGLTAKGLVHFLNANDIARVLQVNVSGSMLMCREAFKLMRKNHYGRIVNISSVHVPLSSVGASLYSASKAALEQFGRVMAREVYSHGITVNALALSVVLETGMAEDLDQATIDTITAKTITQKPISTEDVSHALDFLISERSNAITGQTVYLGGI